MVSFHIMYHNAIYSLRGGGRDTVTKETKTSRSFQLLYLIIPFHTFETSTSIRNLWFYLRGICECFFDQ